MTKVNLKALQDQQKKKSNPPKDDAQAQRPIALKKRQDSNFILQPLGAQKKQTTIDISLPVEQVEKNTETASPDKSLIAGIDPDTTVIDKKAIQIEALTRRLKSLRKLEKTKGMLLPIFGILTVMLMIPSYYSIKSAASSDPLKASIVETTVQPSSKTGSGTDATKTKVDYVSGVRLYMELMNQKGRKIDPAIKQNLFLQLKKEQKLTINDAIAYIVYTFDLPYQLSVKDKTFVSLAMQKGLIAVPDEINNPLTPDLLKKILDLK